MKRISKTLRSGMKSSQDDTVRSELRSTLFILEVSFVFLGILTLGLCSSTTFAKAYVLKLLTFLSTGDNAVQLFAYLSGMFATMVLIGLLAILASLLHLFISNDDKMLAALRFTLKHDSNANIRAKAAEGLADLDLEEATLHQNHEELDDLLVSTLQREQEHGSPQVRAEIVEGLADLELEKHYAHYINGMY